MGRVQHPGCSVCSNSTIVRSNSLGAINPKLAAQWHPTKNGDLTAFDLSPQSNKKVWWKCPKGDDHEYKSLINSRAYGSGCPICTNLITVPSNSLESTHPELAQQWHPTKNGDLTPLNINIGFGKKKIWWKCPKGDDHIWNTKI
jgi:hypothetical protein